MYSQRNPASVVNNEGTVSVINKYSVPFSINDAQPEKVKSAADECNQYLFLLYFFLIYLFI